MNCPYCQASIDDDSRFCDQCGGELFVCSACGKPGKGKHCTVCGKPMVKPGQGQAPAAAAAAAQPAPASPTAIIPPCSAPGVAPPSGGPAAPGLRLVNPAFGIDIRPAPGDVLGRRGGAFVEVFGRFPQVSGTHARIDCAQGLWTVVDLGSTNGTQWNGARLQPQAPQPLNNGGTLVIADIPIRVEIAAVPVAGGTVRV
jgi:hypothetical protein